MVFITPPNKRVPHNTEVHRKEGLIASSASISIYRIPDLIRDLKREGASVVSAIY